jgi:hypothetical protein
MLSLRQATNQFTTRPTNYAVDFAPFKVFKSKSLKYDQFVENKIIGNLQQSLVLSLAVNENPLVNSNNINNNNTAFGVGIKMALWRGEVTKEFKDLIDLSRSYLKKINLTVSQKLETYLPQTTYQLYKDSLLFCATHEEACSEQMMAYYEKMVNLELEKAHLLSLDQSDIKTAEAKMIQIAKNIDFKRTGWKLNLDAAMSYNFPNQSFKNRQLARSAIWLSGGFESTNNCSFLALARYQYHHQELIRTDAGLAVVNNQNIDVGLRFIFDKHPFSISGEIVHRSMKNDVISDSSLKYQINTVYQVGHNMKLTLNLGRDFDGTYNNTGNVITALNFLKGFGSKVNTAP